MTSPLMQQLVALRKRAGVRQEEIASDLGVCARHRSAVGGRRPTLHQKGGGHDVYSGRFGCHA